jgi:hypothetical protein
MEMVMSRTVTPKAPTMSNGRSVAAAVWRIVAPHAGAGKDKTRTL